MDWRMLAACRGLATEDEDVMFPVDEDAPRDAYGNPPAGVAAAKAVCRRCPVVAECLAWALESGQDTGIWGAMTSAERRAIRRPALRPRHTSARSPVGDRVRNRAGSGTCPVCGLREEIRVSGVMGKHTGRASSGRVHCEGTGQMCQEAAAAQA